MLQDCANISVVSESRCSGSGKEENTCQSIEMETIKNGYNYSHNFFLGWVMGSFGSCTTCCFTHVPSGRPIKRTVDFVHVHTHAIGNRLKVHSSFKLIVLQRHDLLMLRDQDKKI